jgi:predicted dehydrogenase
MLDATLCSSDASRHHSVWQDRCISSAIVVCFGSEVHSHNSAIPEESVIMSAESTGQPVSRREFGTRSTAAASAAFGFNLLPSGARGGLERPALAGIGSGGKGRADIRGARNVGFEVAAQVDVVDASRLSAVKGRLKSIADAQQEFSRAKFFTDYREMLSEMGDRIDAVTISTPDHHHYHAAMLAMKAGKHVYCQKPLTHGIWEARQLAATAAATGVKTQMGNQAHANDHMRRCIELIRAGVIGPVTEVHAWTNRPIWPQGFSAAPDPEPVPTGIDWDQWIGPAEWVDYSSQIAPFSWRGWWNFGTGALGDMACHIIDMGYWALMPGAPATVTARQEGATQLSPPINSRITWEFPASQYTADSGFRYMWYDGYIDARFDRANWKLVKNGEDYNHPDETVLSGMDFRKFGSVVIGEEGKLFFHRGNGKWVLQASSRLDGFEWPAETMRRATNQDNYQDWLDAIEGRIDQADSNFALAGPMTETILLGVLAQRAPDKKLTWDHEQLEVTGHPELKQYIQREYRAGWQNLV